MSSPFDAGRDAASGGYGFGEQPGVQHSFGEQDTDIADDHFGVFSSEAGPPSEALGEPAGEGPSSSYTYPTPKSGGDLF